MYSTVYTKISVINKEKKHKNKENNSEHKSTKKNTFDFVKDQKTHHIHVYKCNNIPRLLGTM